tara:strand:+ start:435 stop:1148 length:714 start_codon:yes stop_codon:yes gene_type:complete
MTNFDYENIPIGYYDDVLQKGLSNGKGIQANWHNKKFLSVYELIQNYKVHLDYGCGPGTFIGNYSKLESVGVDISEIQISFAKKKYGTNFEFFNTSQIEQENFNKKFDVITSIELIEHLTDEEILKLLDDLYDLLDEGGILVLTTPNFSSTYSLIELAVNIFGKVSYKEQHINKFNKSRLLELLNQSNFEKIEICKIMNYGIFFSIFSIKFALKINDFFENLFNNNLGFLFLVQLKK